MILRPGRLRRPVLAVAAAFVGLLALPATQYAHDIPSSVTVLAFVKPEAHTLRVVMRVPLAAMRDVNFPVHGPGYLDLDSLAHGSMLGDAARVWIANDLRMYEGRDRLGAPSVVATRVSLPSDRSFTTYEAALAHVSGSSAATATEVMWNQAMLDVELEYPIRNAASRFSVEPTLARLGVHTMTVLRFMLPAGGERDFEYLGDPGLVHLDPSWYQAAARFVVLGFEHIPSGTDHLLFLLCLVIPFRRLRPLIGIVTAFTVAHSVTLIGSASGFAPSALWFPSLIEVLIAASIVYMAIENIVGARLERRWLVAFGFRTRARLRLLVHAPPVHAVRGRAPGRVPAVVQRGRGAGPVVGPRARRARAELAVPARRGRADGDDHSLGVRGAHSVALDARSVGGAVAVRADRAQARRGIRRRRHARRHAAGRDRRRRLGDVRAVSPARAAPGRRRRPGGDGLTPDMMLRLPLGDALRRPYKPVRPALIVIAVALAAIVCARRADAQTDTSTRHAGATTTTLSGIYTTEQASRGQDVYSGSCRGCHTPASHTGATFATYWLNKSVADLFTYVATNMPKNDPGSLDPHDVADVVAYLLKMNQMPAGPTELLPDTNALRQIRIDAKSSPATSTTRGKSP